MIKKLFIPICFLLIGPLFSCKFFEKNPNNNNISPYNKLPQDTLRQHWVNWNLAFTPASEADTANIISQFEAYLTKIVTDSNIANRLEFHFKHCPCDPLLTNMDVTAIFPSGNPVPAPPVVPKPGPQGDYLLGNNFNMYIPEFKDSIHPPLTDIYKYPSVRFVANSPGSPRHRILAVIDTGLDTVRFNKAYPNTTWVGNLLWQDQRGRTIFDVVEGEPVGWLKDNTLVRHGTAATEITLAQIFSSNKENIPQIMSIRAFDDFENGSIYTVSCALSYAIQKKADFINASWGYFGKEDSVLLKYIKRASDSNIRIVAAAGNSPFPHDGGMVCSNMLNHLNDLERLKTKDSVFYPAAFAPKITNLVSVTQLHLHSTPSTTSAIDLFPCFYQNYSAQYITVGVFENTLLPPAICCSFNLPLLHGAIEGSSFATPVMTAILMSSLFGRSQDVKTFINANAPKSFDKTFTLNGNYFPFRQVPHIQ